MSQISTASVIARLMRLGAATVFEAQGRQGALDPNIKAIGFPARLAGPARTAECCAGDNLALHYACTLAKPGEILVVAVRGKRYQGYWGDILTVAAKTAGIAGMVIDGCIRDAESIASMRFPVWGRGLTIRGTVKENIGSVNRTITCGGTQIKPNDIIVCDWDGVVAVPAKNAAVVLRSAEAREKREKEFRRELKRGRTTIELFGLGARLSKIGYLIQTQKGSSNR